MIKEFQLRDIILTSSELNSSSKIVMLALLKFSCWSSWSLTTTHKFLSEYLKTTSISTVKRSLKNLKNIGWISTNSERRGSKNDPTIIKINVTLITKSLTGQNESLRGQNEPLRGQNEPLQEVKMNPLTGQNELHNNYNNYNNNINNKEDYYKLLREAEELNIPIHKTQSFINKRLEAIQCRK